MRFAIKLLSIPEHRPAKEAWIWFSDGWKLVKCAPGLWAGASLSVMALYFLAISVTGILVLPLLQLVPIIIAGLCAQAGLIFLAQPIVYGEVPKSKRFLLFLQWKENKTFWQLVLLIFLIQGLSQTLQHHFFPEPLYQINGEIFQLNKSAVLPYLLFSLLTLLIMLLMSWTAIPLLCDFPQLTLPQLLRLQWQASIKNLWGLLLLSILALTIFSILLTSISLIAIISQTLALTLLILGLMWYWVLFTAWIFSAYRHIFTTW